MDDEPDNPKIRRAYRTLLGNDYERSLTDHVTLSALTKTYGPDFESAWKWMRVAVEEATWTSPPHSYAPALITDAGSALLDAVWCDRETGPAKKIAEFVGAVKATFAILSYASSGSGRPQ